MQHAAAPDELASHQTLPIGAHNATGMDGVPVCAADSFADAVVSFLVEVRVGVARTGG